MSLGENKKVNILQKLISSRYTRIINVKNSQFKGKHILPSRPTKIRSIITCTNIYKKLPAKKPKLQAYNKE